MNAMKKTILALAGGIAVASAAPAFARHDGDRDEYRHGRKHHRVVEIERRVERHYAPVRYVVVERPVVVRRVYVERPVYVQPSPVYYAYPSAPVAYPIDLHWGTVGGTVAGAVIGSRFGKGDGRIASTAVGAVLGGMVGSRF